MAALGWTKVHSIPCKGHFQTPLGSTQISVCGHCGALFAGVKELRCEVDHLPSCIAKFKHN
jgi:hypothetical protein